MNAMLQKHCAKYQNIIPDGLRELMSDISREVIRSNPEQIYTFIADYLDALLITRENARIACRLVDTITEIAETTVNLLNEAGLSREEADRIVTVIQRYFREYLQKKKPKEFLNEIGGEIDEIDAFTQKILNDLNTTYENLSEVVEVIQRAYRAFKSRQKREHENLNGMVDWRIAARDAIRLYKNTGVNIYQVHHAATLIKAAYKGYYTRRVMRKLLQKALGEEDEVGSNELDEMEEAQYESGEGEDSDSSFYKMVDRAIYEELGEGIEPTDEFYTLPEEIMQSQSDTEGRTPVPDEFYTLLTEMAGESNIDIPFEIPGEENSLDGNAIEDFNNLPADLVSGKTSIEALKIEEESIYEEESFYEEQTKADDTVEIPDEKQTKADDATEIPDEIQTKADDTIEIPDEKQPSKEGSKTDIETKTPSQHDFPVTDEEEEEETDIDEEY